MSFHLDSADHLVDGICFSGGTNLSRYAICQFLHNLHNMSISAHVITFIHSLCFGMNMVSNECSCCGIYDDDDNYEVVDSSAMRLDP